VQLTIVFMCRSNNATRVCTEEWRAREQEKIFSCHLRAVSEEGIRQKAGGDSWRFWKTDAGYVEQAG
jgi:hypothetical protein